MIEFEKDLKEEIDFFRHLRQKKKDYIAEKNSLEVLENLIKKSPQYLNEDISKLINKIKKNIDDNGYEDREYEPITANFVEKNINYVNRNREDFLFELVVKGASEQIELFNTIAERNSMQLIESKKGLVYIMYQKIDTHVNSYALNANNCSLLKDIFENSELSNMYVGLYVHFNDVRKKTDIPFYVMDEEEGMIGINSNKFLIRMPTKERGILQSIREVLTTDLPSAMIRNESILKNYPSEKKSSNIMQFLKIMEKIEKKLSNKNKFNRIN